MSTKTTNKTNAKLTIGQQAELFNVRKSISLDTVKVSEMKNGVDYVSLTLSNGKYILYTTYRVKVLFLSDFGAKVTDGNGEVIDRGESHLFNGNMKCVYNDMDSKTAVLQACYDIIKYKDESGKYIEKGIDTDSYSTGIVNIKHDADENLKKDNSKMVIADLVFAKKSDFNKYQTALKKAENAFYKSIKDSKDSNKNSKKDSVKNEGVQD